MEQATTRIWSGVPAMFTVFRDGGDPAAVLWSNCDAPSSSSIYDNISQTPLLLGVHTPLHQPRSFPFDIVCFKIAQDHVDF